jgi:NAD(P)-dependent dehydrogenase (short-subunit alcohol dehydrogenase family)
MLSSLFAEANSFAGKVVVVTGASAGIGRAAAKRFAADGAAVALIARDADALAETAAEIEALGGRALAIAADVADPGAVFAAARRMEGELGPIELWVNNAMLTVFSPVWDIEPQEFRRVTEATYLGYVHGTMAALKYMRPRNRGTILQVGSALAYRGIPLQAAYCGAKHAIRGFTDSLRTELLHEASAIRLTSVHLPAVNTPQFDWARTHMEQLPRPVAPVFQPEAIAEHIHRAALRAPREYWLGRSTAQVIIGNMIAPGVLDRYLAMVAHKGQQRPHPVPSGWPDNLEGPVSGLHRTRGSFGHEATSHIVAVSGTAVRLGWVALVGVAAAGLGWAAATWAGKRTERRLLGPARQRMQGGAHVRSG